MRKIFYSALMILSFAFTATAQNTTVSGTVKSSVDGLPLIGVNVIVKDTSTGAVSDFDGNFTITNVQPNATLVFTYIGFQTKELPASANMNVSLDEDNESLDEIVVIGYGTQKKKEVTGAVTVLGSKAIEKLNPVRVEQALQGQVAGVNVTSNSGSPGAGSNIRIRGVSTNGDSRPLILVDGNRVGDLSAINPSDIKSINVLKDATAGIYGVQAANGVILITTKSGRKNSELKFQFDSYTGIQKTSKKLDLLNPTDFAIYVNDAADDTEFFVYPQTGTDWQDEVFETAIISNVNLSASGGTEKSAYSFGVSYLDQDGIVGLGKSNFNRLTARLNYQYNILDNLKLTATALHTVSEKNNLAEGGIGAVLYNAVNINPNLATRDENGNYSLVEDIRQIEIINPLAQIDNNYNTSRVSKISGTFGIDYTFLENFTVSSKLQMNHANVRDDVFRPEVNYGPSRGANLIGNEVIDHGADYDDYIWDNYITYENTFNDKHNLTVLLGTSLSHEEGTFYGYQGATSIATNNPDQSVWDMEVINPRFQPNQIAVGNNVFEKRLSSIFTRIQYNYKGKYLLSAVMRRDGSSAFGPNNKYGYFPSGSIGWNISEEDFLKDSSWLNSLKVRASYGVIGNDKIRLFGFTSLLTGEATYDPGNATGIPDLLNGVAIGLIGNPNIQWEEQVSKNFGLDTSLFNNKVSISADIYSKLTEKLLIAPDGSGLLGAAAPGSALPIVNAGSVENKGVEFSINYNDNFTEDFKFNVGFNFTTLQNEVLSVDVGGNGIVNGGDFGVGISQTTSRMQAGMPMGYFYGYQTNGIYQTQSEIDVLNASAPEGVYHATVAPGDLKFVDTNGNGYIDPDDRTNLGDPLADITMGFNIGFTYKNLDFSANAFASIGNDMVRDYERKDLYANRGTYMLNRWQGTGTSNTVPRAVAGASVNTDVFSDFYVEDASFLRLQNVQIGYSFNPKVLSSLGLDKFRIYVSGNNLYTLTDYLGYDPSASNGAPIGSGIDKGFYPVASSYLLGVNLNF
ncbi:TonB-dependent receptor [Flavobacteriaceae bacterium]|jgi:TonB-dependent starch-binding outer membrane protein SusC|nr:TonB-dependent receptor [Flavobacteriaceae bacterium]MDA7728098.1 TonB-dependent receptor [Flavobacteriaceae bacterium]MDA7849270.1 TonB-dependent receptor [Flavobacteriaceae bacterium]|tara:strand:- start:34038 stop:37103 length:3066 start_codon:yes stop_codon:yes gene_type:complete